MQTTKAKIVGPFTANGDSPREFIFIFSYVTEIRKKNGKNITHESLKALKVIAFQS